MRVTLLPSRVNSSADWISAVGDSMLVPARGSEQPARLMNWKQLGEFLVITTRCMRLTDVLPLPVAPMTLW